jgi:hypothetical protein
MRIVMAALVALALSACGEPPVDVAIPPRDGAFVADLAGILDADGLEEQLAATAAAGLDVVALTYTTPQANCGEAFRAGLEFAQRWEADVALVAVARPGDFTSTDDARLRCLGLRPVDDFAVPRGLREEIAEELVPPIAAENDWDAAFEVAARRLTEELTDAGADVEAGGSGG